MKGSGKRSLLSHVSPVFDLELRHLRAFIALVENGSITRASQALHLAQSTVSEAIISLERALGTRLIDRRRGNRAAALTTCGRAFLPCARNVLVGIQAAYLAVARTVVSARGALSIIANESISTYVLSHALITMRQRWKNTMFSVTVATCEEVREGVRNGRFDLGLLLEPANLKTRANAVPTNAKRSQGRQVVAPLVPLVIFAAPEHPLVKSSSRVRLRQCALDSFPLFISDADGDFPALLERFYHEDQMLSPRLESTGSIEGVKTGVLSDPRGLGVLPLYAIREEIRTGRVVRLTLHPPPPQMHLVALLSRLRPLHPGIGELLEEMRRFCDSPLQERPA